MALIVRKGSGALRSSALPLSLLLPRVASADWGENWDEMVWGGAATPVPSLSLEGLSTLAIVLVLVTATLLARRRRRARS